MEGEATRSKPMIGLGVAKPAGQRGDTSMYRRMAIHAVAKLPCVDTLVRKKTQLSRAALVVQTPPPPVELPHIAGYSAEDLCCPALRPRCSRTFCRGGGGGQTPGDCLCLGGFVLMRVCVCTAGQGPTSMCVCVHVCVPHQHVRVDWSSSLAAPSRPLYARSGRASCRSCRHLACSSSSLSRSRLGHCYAWLRHRDLAPRREGRRRARGREGALMPSRLEAVAHLSIGGLGMPV